MKESFNISALNTKRVSGNAIVYNFREIMAVRHFIEGITCSYKGVAPFYIARYCMSDSKDALVESIDYLTDLYSKKKGIMLRGQFITVSKDSFVNGNDTRCVVTLANEYAKNILYRGFHFQINIYDMGENYMLLYLINPINYIDGSKYKHNAKKILSEQEDCFGQCLSFINGFSYPYDFTALETYPLPF